jgi:hypothetical protein
MTTIHKYALDITDFQTVHLPKGAEILDAQMQRGNLHIWAIVDTNAPAEPRTFCIHGTGHPLPHAINRKYLSSVQDGNFVWHVFEVVK